MNEQAIWDEIRFWVFLVFVVAALFVSGFFIGGAQATYRVQRQAIETGHGHIVITDSLTGATQFRWKENSHEQ